MGRKLRKNTRKNYSKMADEDSENGDVENGGERLPIADVNKATTADDEAHDNNGDIINNELFLHDDSDGNEEPHVHANDSADSDSSDDEIKNAEQTLKEIKKQQKKLIKQAKLERIAKETKDAQKLLKKLKCGGGKVKEKKEITVASLRAMDDVVEEVDKLMEKKKLKAKKVANISSSDSSSSDSSSSSSESSDTEKKEEKKEKKISGMHKSGKSKKLTSKVKFPQEWPQSNLSLHFVNREKKYEDLTLAEFCAGYSSILRTCGKDTRKHRVAHLEELMYLATKYQWRCILNYHAACLLEIERGHRKWGDSFQTLQSTTLAGGFLHSNAAPRSGNGSKDEGTGSVFCPGYNRGTCQQSRDHYGQLRGENRLLKHMCAKCWLRTKKVVNHPETSDSCPLKDES